MTGSKAYPGSVYLMGIDAHNAYVPYNTRTAASTTTWTVAKNVSGSYSYMTASTAATVFTTLVKPFGTTLTANPVGWVFGPYTGVFQQFPLSFTMSVNASTVNAQVGLLTYRIWRANSPGGSGASLITPTYRKTSGVTLATTPRLISASFSLTSSLSMQNEYLVLECAWGITTAGGANGCNVIFNAGSSSFFRTGPYEDNTFILTGGEDTYQV